MIHALPIEPYKERYSNQWYNWFRKEFKKLEIEHSFILSDSLSHSIRQGSFLDVIGTNYYKAGQLQRICNCFDNEKIKDGDAIFAFDGWFPGIEMLAYIRDALDLKFKIYAIFHAGTYDPCDFLTQKGMSKWGEFLEKSWFKIYDGIFVATEFHKEMILNNRSDYIDRNSGVYLNDVMEIKEKIYVTGLPIYPEFVNPDIHKENIIVFPHRLDPEKQPEEFDKMIKELKKELPDWCFIKTKQVTANKKTYYEILNKAKISVSCALQETWGIAMQESVMCGCIPIVPNRLSYKELYPAIFRYCDYEDLKEKIEYFTETSGELLEAVRLEVLRQQFIKKGAEAIPNMVKIMMEN